MQNTRREADYQVDYQRREQQLDAMNGDGQLDPSDQRRRTAAHGCEQAGES